MHSFLFLDLVTINGKSTMTSVAQSDADYLDLAAYQDFTAWVDVTALDAGGASAPKLWLESGPLKDSALFTPQGGVHTSVPLAVGVTTARNVLNAPTPYSPNNYQIPLARWLRWRLDLAFASATWSVTLRIHLAAHSVCLPRVR